MNPIEKKSSPQNRPRRPRGGPEVKLYSLNLALDEVDGKGHAPAALPRERSCTHCLRGGRALGPVWTGAENVPPPHWDSITSRYSPYRAAVPTRVQTNNRSYLLFSFGCSVFKQTLRNFCFRRIAYASRCYRRLNVIIVCKQTKSWRLL